MDKLDEVLELIKDGKTSIREASRMSGYGRDYLKACLIKKYGMNEEEWNNIEEQLANNKANSTTISIDANLLEDVFLRTMSGEITLAQAKNEIATKFGDVDMETLKANFFKFIQDNKDNESLLLKYREYKKSNTPSYKGIKVTNLNFRCLAIYMIKNRMSQTDLAKQIGVTPRTISRKFEEFKDDEDQSLYSMLKFYSDTMMKRKKLTEYQEMVLNVAIRAYEERHPELLSKEVKSKEEEKIERIQFVVAEADKLKAEGLSQAEIAAKLGISVSTIRRARLFIVEQELLDNNKSTKEQKEIEDR